LSYGNVGGSLDPQKFGGDNADLHTGSNQDAVRTCMPEAIVIPDISSFKATSSTAQINRHFFITSVKKPPTFPGNQRMKPTQRQGFLVILRP